MGRVRVVIPLITVFLFALLGFFALRGADERVRLSGLLQDVSIDRLEVDGRIYTVRAGRVVEKVGRETSLKILHLTAFYQWNKEDPLFYSPDFDVDEFARALAYLEEEEKGLLAVIGETRSIYPVTFLRSLRKTASLTRDFFSDPSDDKAQKLIESQQESASAYESEAKSLARYVRETHPEGLVGFNTRTSTKITLSDLEKIGNNSEFLLSEIKKREKCLLGVEFCQRAALSFQAPRDLSSSSPNLPDLLPKELIYTLPKNETKKIAKVKGPYQTSTPCFGWGDNFSAPDHFFYINYYKHPTNKNGLASVRLATDMFFRKLPVGSRDSFDRILKDRGINYLYTYSGMPYLCRYQGYLQEIVVIDQFLSKHKPIFPKDEVSTKPEIKSFFKEAQKQEAIFFEEKYPSYRELSNLAGYYAYAYKLVVSSQASELGSLKEEFLKRYLEIDRKLGGVDKTINNQLFLTSTHKLRFSIQEEENKSIRKEIIYSFRAQYGLMYLPFSKSIWRSSDSLDYLEKIIVKNAVGVDGGFINYREAVKKYPEEEINKWYTPSQPVLTELLEKKKQ